MEHKSESNARGGKNVTVHPKWMEYLVRNLKLEFKAKGYKSSENGVELPPPDDLQPTSTQASAEIADVS